MRNVKRLISVLLILATLTCCLASCNKGKKNSNLIESAEAALNEAPYAMDIVVQYTSDNAAMALVIDGFSKPTMKINVDGDKFKARLDLVNGEAKSYISHTFVDGVLYTEWQENGVTNQEITEYTETDKATLNMVLGENAGIGPEDFEEIETKSVSGLSKVTCSKIKREALEALIASLESDFAALGFVVDVNIDVAIKDATLELEIEDGKYNAAILTCLYYVTTAEGSYSVTMTHSTRYTYTKELEIIAPEFN